MHRLLLPIGLTRVAGTDTAKDVTHSVLSAGAAIGAGLLTRKLLTTAWTRATGEEPPKNPADPTVGWQQALTWAAATGVGVGVGRVLGRRLAADVWEGLADEAPPLDRDLDLDAEA